MVNFDRNRLAELQESLATLPRISLASLPTPLEFCLRLTEALEGPRLWIKRDDLTGLATGGNKTRMFEYVLGEAVRQGADTVIGGAAVQSNYCRQLAASCARLGLDCHLILRKVRGERDQEIQGGLLLDLLVGARVELVEGVDWVGLGELIRQKAEAFEAQGRRVYVARVGDASRLGLDACAYVRAVVELLEQADGLGLDIDEIWLCSSDATQSGLAIALKHLQAPIRLVGVPALPDPVTPGQTFAQCMAAIGNQCAEILGLPTRLVPEDIVNLTAYVGPGYAVLTDEAREAMRLVGRTEGLLLDPVYTAKAMAGLIDHIRRGLTGKEGNVVFLHTGGLPALFAYAETLGLEDLLHAEG